MIAKTEALVLRWYPVSETSRVVSWLTPDRGRLATLIKGSQRPKSAFLGHYDLFQTCELLYYARPHEGLMIIREVSPLRTRERLRTDWRACGVASYLSGLMGRITPPEAVHAELYHLLNQCLDELADEGASAPLLFWFELRLLHALGLAPRLQRCLDCGCAPQPGRAAGGFAYIRGGWLCPDCNQRDGGEHVPMLPDVLALLVSWQRAPSSRSARTTRLTARQQAEVERLLGLFMVHHLEQPLTGRAIALDLLARRLPAQSTLQPPSAQ